MEKKKASKPSSVRKTVGVCPHPLKVLKKPERISITTKVPEKWVIIDTESMHVYGWSPKNARGGGGWIKPDYKVLESALICLGHSLDGLGRSVSYPSEATLGRLGFKKVDRFETKPKPDQWHF